MSVKGFTFGSDPTVQKYDYDSLDNKPDIEGIESDITNERLARQEADLEFEEAIHTLADTKASIDGTYPSLAVGSLLGDSAEDKTPYLFRPTGGGLSVGDREYDEIVGGTVGWNQLVQNGNFASTSGWIAQECSFTVGNNVADITFEGSGAGNQLVSDYGGVVSGHKYFSSIDVKVPNTTNVISFNGGRANSFVTAEANTNWQTLSMISGTESYRYVIIRNTSGGAVDHVLVKNCILIDLTALFGATIADYIYSLEQATAGAGVAWFRQYFGKDYYPYSTPTLKSVEGLTAHVMRDADNNIVGSYPLDSTWIGRGILKLDSANKLYYDGDVYAHDGTVTRRYGIVDLGTLDWGYVSDIFYSNSIYEYRNKGADNILCDRYPTSHIQSWSSVEDKHIVGNVANGNIYIKDSAYTDAATFKTAMSGQYLVYELATPTEETAEPYEEAQICDPNGTEQYVTESIVPVGHATQYPENLADKMSDLPSLPTAAGEYKLKVTVTSGKASYTWVSA